MIERVKEYSEFLQKYNWDYFVTATFRSPRREPYYALKGVQDVLESKGAFRGFLGVEPHSSGDLHIHGIVSGHSYGGVDLLAQPHEIWSGLHSRFGRARVELCRSQQDVAAYCAKYVVKAQTNISDHYHFYGKPYTWAQGLISYPSLLPVVLNP